MTNIHRLTPLPKVRRRGAVRCEIADDVRVRELMLLPEIGLQLTNNNGVLRIERTRQQETNR